MQLISVIVTTYNWPQALLLCLKSLYAQTDVYFEIIIADDGSRPENLALIEVMLSAAPVKVQLAHHADLGFRAAAIRNKAVALSQGEYLVFVDGDCVLPRDFIAQHRTLAEQGYFVPGNRVLLSQQYTHQVLQDNIELQQLSRGYLGLMWLQGNINRISALMRLPLGALRKWRPKKWQQAMTCNLAIWRSDFIQINGFDEIFEGWGYEDSDLVIRLIHQGVKRKEGRFALPVFHLWHAQNDRSQETSNLERLHARLADKHIIRAAQGVSQYIE